MTPSGMDDHKWAWSPDGRWLVVQRSPEGSPLAGDLWAIPTAAGEAVQITRTPEIEFDPRWF